MYVASSLASGQFLTHKANTGPRNNKIVVNFLSIIYKLD